LTWLKENLPNSELIESFELIPPATKPAKNTGRGLSSGERRNLQRMLKGLIEARDLLPALRKAKKHEPRIANRRKVFVVHGHNEALKVTVARMLEHLDLEPVILHEQANRGRTIIEKFADYSDVSFAVVLLTGDDKGGVATVDPTSYKLRARQNVILELGYFLGHLGRERVAAICEDGVDVPSDYHGVLFIPYDKAGAWKYSLGQELRDSGLKIDLNRL
jgi:predicted nucleotide-binding protein